MLDKVSPLRNLMKEVGVGLCPQLLMVVSDIELHAMLMFAFC